MRWARNGSELFYIAADQRLTSVRVTFGAGGKLVLGPPLPLFRTEFDTSFMTRQQYVVSSDGQEVKLTAKEFMLLQYMLQRRGRVLSRDLLLSDVWGYQYTGGTRTVDVHVRRLREKLPVLVDALVTVKQFGYKLADT